LNNAIKEEINQNVQVVQTNNKIWKVIDFLSEISLKFSSLILFFITVSIWYQIFTRIVHINNRGIVELGGFLLVWVLYLGIASGMKKGRHIRVDIIYGRLPKKIQNFLTMISDIICVVFSFIITWEGIKLVNLFYKMGERAILLGLPMYLVYIVIPVGMFLFALEAIREFFLTLRKI